MIEHLKLPIFCVFLLLNFANSFNIIEQVEILPHLRQDLFTLIDIFNKNIEEAINNFYHQRKNNFSVLNINSMLVNADTILITYEYFE